MNYFADNYDVAVIGAGLIELCMAAHGLQLAIGNEDQLIHLLNGGDAVGNEDGGLTGSAAVEIL